jgi:hypothetical protein
MAKKNIPDIVKAVRAFTPTPIDYTTQKNISYSQLSMFMDCARRWQIQYVEGIKPFTSSVHTVFGTALHEVLQHYLTVMYEKSGTEADRINTSDMFEDALRNEYKKQYVSNKKQHFVTPEQLREFYDDGIDIIRDFAKNKGAHFSKRGWHLIGCEIPVSIAPHPEYPNVIFNGFLDVVMYHEPTNTIKIIDIKTSGIGWRDKEKKNETKQFQLILYKHFFSTQFNFPIDNIEIEFFIVKRKVPEESDFPIKRIQIFKPASGKTKVKKAVTAMNNFIESAFSTTGYNQTQHSYSTGDGCKWCPFHKVHHCEKTYNS